MKKLFVDVETTGLNPDLHGITQLSAIAEIDGKIVGRFNEYMRPSVHDICDAYALNLTGVTEKELRDKTGPRLGPKPALRKFEAFLGEHVDQFDRDDKFTLYEYSVGFDINFLSAWFQKLGNDYFGSYQNYKPVHILAIVRYLNSINCKRITNLPNLRLQTVCSEFGIEIEKPHDSFYDVKATHEMWGKLECLLPQALEDDGLYVGLV